MRELSLNAKMRIICPKCGKDMEYLGNIDNSIMLSYPSYWKETYVCHKCKGKKKIFCRGEGTPDYSYAETYKDVD
jgi:hypothetical protein